MPLELTITLFIAAPPEKVWQVMTGRITEWWCPRPWRTEFEALEWRAGGAMKGMMRGPEPGDLSPMDGLVLEFTPGKRFIFTDAFRGDWMPHQPFMTGIFAIAAETADGITGTRYTASARHWTEEACKQHAEMGFADGWIACARQLQELCEAAA